MNVDVFFVSQAAIQASKLRAKEVDLKHFEWAKVKATGYEPVVSRNNDASASARIELSWESRGRVIILIQKLNFPRLIMRYVRHFYLRRFCQNFMQGGHALVALFTDGAMPLHKVTCIPRGHALGLVSLTVWPALSLIRLIIILFFKTSQLAEDDRYSISFKQYLADIDVSMGGRVAEELSKSFFAHSLVFPTLIGLCYQFTEEKMSQVGRVPISKRRLRRQKPW